MLPCFALLTGWSRTSAAGPPDDDGFSFEDQSDESEGDAPEPEAEPDDDEFIMQPVDAPEPSDDADGELSESSGFVFEDISEDEEALAATLKSGQVQASGEVGTVAGRVVNADNDPLAGVYVRVAGTDFVGRTGVDGRYSLDLPPGTHTLIVELDLYKSTEIPGVSVSEGAIASVDVELVPMIGVMEIFEVSEDLNMQAEGALQEQRKQQTSVNDGVDATEISKSGGGKVSSVAVRIVGATVVDGRYLFVRGLGHRYGNTLLDGARVPSPEPERRTVPLDMFPSAALSAINVQKTFSPDVPGDFSGGSTQFVTRDAPYEPTISIGLTTGANTNTTFAPMLTNPGYAGPDLFALGNLPRALPDSFTQGHKVGRGVLDPNNGFAQRYTPEQIEAQGEALDTRTQVMRGARAPANFGVKLSGGNTWTFNDNGGNFGILFAGGYKNQHQTNRELVRQFSEDGGALVTATPQVDLRSFQTTYQTSYNGLLKLQLHANSNNRFALTTLYAREASDESRDMVGTARGPAGVQKLDYTRLRYVMRSVASTQLSGEHTIPRANNLQIDYFGSVAQARRDDPALREMVYLYNTTDDYWVADSSVGPTGDQLFLELLDNNVNGALNLTAPFRQWKGLEAKIKAGAWVEAKQRNFLVRRYDYTYATGLEGQIPIGRGEVLTNDNIGGGLSAADGGSEVFVLNERTRENDNYDAWSRNLSAYLMMDLPFVRWFKISGGARIESNTIVVNPYDPYALPGAGPDAESEGARLVEVDVLPAASLIFSPQLREGRGDINIRLTGTQTVARPEFRELAPFQFRDYVGGFTKQGYPGLISTKVWNGDVRVEWFPRTAEVIAISGFFKYFQDPIEEVVALNPSAPSSSFANAESAINGGVELEFRKALDFLAPKHKTQARKILRDLSLGANFAYIYSRVDLPAPCYDPLQGEASDPSLVPVAGCREEYQASTSQVRPLQGQSPWIVNAFLDYSNDESGTNARLMYNAFGPYITQVSGMTLPDIYQQPMHMLDFSASQRLLSSKRNEWGDLRNQLLVTVEIENLLNTPIRQTQAGKTTYLTHDGLTATIGLTWKY